jgi:Tfp pilus assembly protein PilF
LLREYAKRAPKRNGYPSPAAARAWLGRLYVIKNDLANAKEEFENALRLDPKNKMAQEELKKIKKD